MKAAALAVSALAAGLGAFAAAEAKASRGKTAEEPEYLLILGNTVHGEEPSEILKTRIKAAAEYLNAHPSVTAIPCGGIVQKDQTKAEAEVIAERLIEAGISPERIIKEDQSQTTRANFRNAKKIIEEQTGGKEAKIGILSSECHLLRASLIAKSIGVPIMAAIPAPSPKDKIVGAYIREFFVFSSAFVGK